MRQAWRTWPTTVLGDATQALPTRGGICLLRVTSGDTAAARDPFQRPRFWDE